MNDNSLGIREAQATVAASELDVAMQPYIDSGNYSKEELAKIRKRLSNQMKNEKERKRQEITKTKQKTIQKPKEKEKSSINHNELYTNSNPLHSSLRHDANLKEGRSFWELEEEDAVEFLREKYKNTGFSFEETNIAAELASYDERKAYEESGGKRGKKYIRRSFEAIKIIAPDDSEEVVELDIKGFFEPEEGWDTVKIENYNKLSNFIDTHLTEKGKSEILKDDKTRANVLSETRKNHMEPSNEEYEKHLQEKNLTSTDIFDEKKEIQTIYTDLEGGKSKEITLEFGGYEDDIEHARKQLIKEGREKSVVSSISYVDPTIDEIKQRTLQNLQSEEKSYLRKHKYDSYMSELEDFEDWDDEVIIKRAKEEFGLKDHEIHLPKGKAFRDKVKKEMKKKYYQLKVAGNTDEAKAVLDYRANELQLKHTVESFSQNNAWKRYNTTNTNIQDLNHKYERHENEVQLDNGKIIPLHIWEQHTRDHTELQPIFNDLDRVRKKADASIKVLTDKEFKWDLIARNYNDWERTQEVLGYGFASLGMTAVYGVPKLLTFGASGGDDEIIRWKNVVSKNRESFRKDVDWDHAFEDGNFGRFMGQSVVDQIPIYATLATGYAGLGILGASVFGDKWAEMTMEERATGDFYSKTNKWFKSLGYAASEVVLDWAITVPIMRNAKNMMFSGSGKALLDNSTKGFFRQYAAKSLVFSPVLESISESATQISQNMIDGRSLLEGIDHAAFLGLTMGMGISYSGFTSGVITSQFSDHKSLQEVRDNITEMQKLFNINADLKQGLKYKLPKADRKKAEQQKKDNEARIKELVNENNDIINRVNNNIKNRLTPKAYRAFLANERRAEEIKVEAQKIYDSNLDTKTKNKRLKILLAQFNMAKAGSKYFKDPKSFGSKWAFIVNPSNKEQEENLERLKDLARIELQNEGKQDPDEKRVLERARNVWAKEQARESNESYKRTNLTKNYKSIETIDEAIEYYNDQIQKEIDALQKNIDNNIEGFGFTVAQQKQVIKNLEKDRKKVISNLKSGKTYGVTHVPISKEGKGESMSFSVIETQAKAERFETRTHEGGHQVFWNALQAAGGNEIFIPMAEQIVDWAKKNDTGMFKRIMLRTDNGTQSASEIVSVFLEEVGDGKFDVKKNKGFTNLWGLMSNDAISKTTGKDFEFDFAGETDVMNFLVGLGKKIKDGTFTKTDERAVRKRFPKTKASKKAKSQFSKQGLVNPRAQEFLDLEIDNKSLVDIVNSPQSTPEDRFGAIEALIERNWPIISKALKFNPTGNIPMWSVKEAISEQMLGIFPQVTLPDGGKISRSKPLFDTYNKENEVTTFLDATLRNRQAEIFTRAKAIGGTEQMGVDISEAKDITTPPVKTKPKSKVVKEKVALETFRETDLQNEIRTDVVTFGVEGVNKYLDVKKALTAHRKFMKDGTEITPELKAKYKREGKKPPKELKSKRIPTGKYYPILEKIAKMYGVDPLRLIREQDFTTTQRKNSQNYILARRDEHIVSLPEGTTKAGDPTGIANTALGKAFFEAGGRTKFKTTGTGKGLKEQAKQRIEPSDYLAIFGLIPRARVNNTSVDPALRSQIIQTAVIATDQAVRQEKDALELSKERVDRLKEGKGAAMYSQDTGKVYNLFEVTEDNFEDLYIFPPGLLPFGIHGINRVPNHIDGPNKKTRNLDALFTYTNENGDIIETGETYGEAGIRVVRNFLKSHPEFRSLLRITMTGGKKQGFFQFTNRFDELFPDTGVTQEYLARRKYSTSKTKTTESGLYSPNFHENLNTREFNEQNDARLPQLLKFFQAVEAHLQHNPEDVWMFDEMLVDTGKQQNVLTRILAPFAFYPIDPATRKPIFNQIIAEEHTDPQNLIGKALLAGAVFGNLDAVWKVVGKSYMQGAILDNKQNPHDTMINNAGYKSAMPKVYYDKIVPRLLSGELKLPNGYSSIVRLAESKIDLNMYYLHNEGMTIAEYFGVEGMEISIANDLVTKQLTGEVTLEFAKAMNKVNLKERLNEINTLNKAITSVRSQYSQESKGITILDFDDTLATTKSLVRFITPDGIKGTLNAEEYALQYQDLLAQGYKFDFTEFDKVVKAKLAPLFNKALKLQKKFGPENMFILTARPLAAQKAIFDFLKANGLNIPLKNISALGNSTAEAKALWVAEKVGEGYNDFYFADDALQNVQAVKNMLNQFDVKSKVQQARAQFSQESVNKKFNDILEEVTGIESKKRFSAVKARKRGASKGKFRFFIPPSHEDLVGLIYNFLGKGKKGDAHRNFFEQVLIRPLNRAYRELNTAKQAIANDYKSLNKEFKNVKKKLTKKTPDGDFTYQDAIRVYLWNKHGHRIPGLTKTDQQNLVDLVMADPELQVYAETLNIISKQDTYVSPTESWEGGDIRTDLDDATGRIGREQFFIEFFENADIIFSEENLNKIEAAYGAEMVSAIKDILYRTKTGRNRPSGQNKHVNMFLNYLNGSVASTMFFNMRSAVLQQMSMVNFINFADNNIFAAAKAFANQKQYWTDWAFIFNSDMLKQRRGGIKTDVNGAELAASLRGARNTPRALLAKLLQLGFLPTQIGDNIAIATGGATFYRNRVNTYLKQGLSQKEAQEKAWVDFQTLAEATQQSARPDMVSQQQASPLGKVILAFQNVTSQFNRLGKKAFLDIKNRRITPGNTSLFQSDVSNLSRIGYYFAIQNLVFYSLQSALFLALFEDDEDDDKWLKKKERVISGSIDSILRGTGVWGAVAATLKNMAIKRFAQDGKNWNADVYAVMAEALQVSPPLGIKARKMVQAERDLIWKRKIIDEMETFDIDNPIWSAYTSHIEALTNAPTNRIYNKTQNVRQSLNNQNEAYKRALLFSGWSQWNLGIENEKMEKIKEKAKKSKKKKSTGNYLEKQKQEREEGKKDIKCADVSKSGDRCRNVVESSGSYCTIHVRVKQRADGKKMQCKRIKGNGKRCKMNTSNNSGYCYYHD